MKKDKITPSKDFKALTREGWTELNEKITTNFVKHDQEHPPSQSTDPKEQIKQRLDRMNKCIQDAIETNVPTKKRLSQVKRCVSDTTRRLYEVRAQKFSEITTQGGTPSKQLRKRWNRKIRDANLNDYVYDTRLSGMATVMEEADKRGDSKTIFRVVKLVSGQMVTASAGAPSVDKNDDLILDQCKLTEL